MSLKAKRNIVDIVLDIMDDGPRPMKNMKVTERNRNCVDQFWDAHQAEYEARGKPSKDTVKKVNRHNMAYPRLGDELDKRKSLSKIKTKLRRDDSPNRYEAGCPACTKLRRLSQVQKYIKLKSRQRKIKSKTRPRDIKSRIWKNRYRKQKIIKNRLPKTISVNKIKKCHCHYVRVKHKKVGNDTSISNLLSKNSKRFDNMTHERMSSSSRTVNDRSNERMNSSERTENVTERMNSSETTGNVMERMNSSERTENVMERMNSSERTENVMPNERMNGLKSEEESGQGSKQTLKNPDTSVASISTYNSYASMDHEPMVNMEL